MVIKKNTRYLILIAGLIFVEISLLSFLFFLNAPIVIGGTGENVTVITRLTVGNVYPEVLNVSINNGSASITLIANSTRLVSCIALVRDYNNESDISNVYSEFFYEANSSWNGTDGPSYDDNNNHYTNVSCNLTPNFTSWNGVNDDQYLVLANCSFNLQYYAYAGEWNCTVSVNDSVNWKALGSDNITVNSLLAIAVPNEINYGTVNATEVSKENITNVTNMGNVGINLSLEGYAQYEGDGNAMNCSQGSLMNISVEYEKYNLTTSTPGNLSFSNVDNFYANLSSNEVVRVFNLNSRENDIYNEATDETYWRMYVPIGVAGSCQGNIIFGARQQAGT